MKKLIGGLFETQENANLAYEALERSGFASDEINMFIHKPKSSTTRSTEVSIQEIAKNAIVGGLIGGAIGGGLAIQARRMSGRKVTRQSHYFGTAGIILGALITPTLWVFFQTGFLYFSLAAAFNISTLACTVGMIMAAWGVFLRRI